MYPEVENQWVKVGDKDGRNSHHRQQERRRDEDTQRQRGSRREAGRYQAQGRGNRGANGIRNPGTGRMEEREEGEIRESNTEQAPPVLPTVEAQEQPSAAFQATLLLTQASPMKVNNGNENENLEVLNQMETEAQVDDNGDMDLGEALACLEGSDFLSNIEEQFHIATEEELGEVNQEHTAETNMIEAEVKISVEGEQEQIQETKEKKMSVRKAPSKTVSNAAGSNKLRMAHSLLASKKRSSARTGDRTGDGGKQMEDKGPSNPKPNIPAP